MNDDAGINYSEELLRALFSTLSDVAFVIDEHGRYVDILAQPQKDGLLSADLITLKGKLLHDVFPRENADLFLSIVQKTIETQQNQHLEYLLPVQVGERWFEGRTAPLHIPGQNKMVIWVSRDVTERKMAFEKIRNSATSLAEAQRLAHIGNWDWDITGDAIWWSDEVYRILGFTPGEFTATYQDFLKSVHPDDREYVREALEKAVAGEISYSIDHRIVRVDGTVRIVHEEGAVIRDAAQKPVKMIGTVQDITERKQEETALLTNAHFLSESQRLGHIGSFLLDRQGVLSWSDEMYHLFGVSQDTFKPSTESLLGLIHPDDRASVQAWIASCAAGEKPDALDFRINRPDGTVRFIRGNGDAAYDDRGALAFLAGTAQDVTRDKQAEATLRQNAEELEARVQERTAELEEKTMRAEVASQAKTDFLSNMSHELRTPLNSIIGFSEILKSGDAGTLTADQNEFLGNIWTSGKHLSRTIDDMLAFADLGSNKPKLLASEFDIKEMLEEVISRHAARAAKQKIKIGTEIADEIGHVVADKHKIVQVVDHLLENAVKFTPAGGVVLVSARRTGDTAGDRKLEIAVADSGIGIAKEDMAQLFQPFKQLAAPLTKTFGGIGLGLAICKKYVEFHGGRIWCESEPGKGSTFVFTLPVTP